MKITLLFLLIGLPFICSAQIPGKRIPGPLKLSNGIEFHEGDTVYVGSGTDPNGDFKFIYNPPNYLLGVRQQGLTKALSNTHVAIKHFNRYTNKKIGTKDWAVVNFGGVLNGVIELQQAFDSGEIIVKGQKPESANKIAAAQAPASVADELLKLKKLMDAGAITKDEYNAQKKKLLSN